jgi:hypothetical protein
MSTASHRVVTVARQRFELRRDQVERTMRYVLPEPIISHYVVIDRRRYPPKQVLGVLTGIDRADFTSHQARRILTGLGFAAGRQPSHEPLVRGIAYRATYANPDADLDVGRSRPADRSRRPDAEKLEPFIGQWVATSGSEVLVAAPDPRTVVSWLAEHRRQADSMFRVPGDELEASGAAPL